MKTGRLQAWFTKWPVYSVTLLLAIGLGYLLGGAGRSTSDVHEHAPGADRSSEVTETEWTCSMHPQFILPDEGQCPICFMDLIPLEKGAEQGLDPADLVLTETAAALAEIMTEPVQRRLVATEVRLVGKVTYDETRTAHIAARVPGRLDRLFVDYTGQTVARGEPLAEIYSPELYAAQAELHAAVRSVQAAGRTGGVVQRNAQATLVSVRDRLRLWGMTDEQIAELEKSETVSDHLTLRAPIGGVVVEKSALAGIYVAAGSSLYTIADMSRVWVRLEAYEKDLGLLRVGQSVTFAASALSGRDFTGQIAFIDPVLDSRTRTVGVRVEVENNDGLLKPGMLIKAVTSVTLDADHRPVLDPETATAPLVIPDTAVLLTGTRAVVYVRQSGAEPVFSGREVDLGPRAGRFYLVNEGLEEGELVVTNGNFKIDSALQIQARPSMMNSRLTNMTGEQTPGVVPATHVVDVPAEKLMAPSCFLERIENILEQYLILQTALAGDDDGDARQAAQAVQAALEQVSCGGDHLPGDSQQPWQKMYDSMHSAITRIAEAGDIAVRRQAFQPLSNTLWVVLTSFAVESSLDVGLFHCPMAFDDEGADWIQTGKTVANPYYGAMMLRCGFRKQSLTDNESDEDR